LEVTGPELKRKGIFVQIDNMTYCWLCFFLRLLHLAYARTDMTGNEKATKGIVYFYDIYGFTAQALQGADILAYDDPETTTWFLYLTYSKGLECMNLRALHYYSASVFVLKLALANMTKI
jgi:hypothetical protein